MNSEEGISKIGNLLTKIADFGAGGGARTRTVVTPRDFKSLVSAIPPHRQAGIF